jgi:hypothetical protein
MLNLREHPEEGRDNYNTHNLLYPSSLPSADHKTIDALKISALS